MTLSTTVRLAAAATLVAAAVPAGAATAVVRYADDSRLTDAGSSAAEIDRTRKVIAGHFERLAARLPADQTLTVTVGDVDLAGHRLLVDREMLRVVHNGEAARLEFHYELKSGAQTVASGNEVLSDVGLTSYRHRLSPRPLEYVARQLDAWYRDALAPNVAATR